MEEPQRSASDQLLGTNRSHSQDSLYSDDSLLLQAPLARQTRCSIDIDTIEPLDKSVRPDGNAYLDSMPLRESIQELS